MTGGATVLPSVSLAPVSRSGVLLGLGWRQLLVCLVAIAPAAWQGMTSNMPGMARWALAFTLPLLVIGAGSWGGRSFLGRVETVGLHTARRMTGRTTVRGSQLTAQVGLIGIPGAVDERVRVLSMVGTPFAAGCFLWDRGTGHATVAIRVETTAWNFASTKEKKDRFDALGQLCQDVANTDGVVRVAMHARTYAGHPSELPRPGEGSEPWSSAEYTEMLTTTAGGRAWHRDVLITVTVDRAKVRREVDEFGGGRAGMAVVLADRLEALYPKLEGLGMQGDDAVWLSAGHVRAAVRLALDPAAGPWLAQMGWSLPDDMAVGAGWSEPLGAIVTPSAMIRTYWCERFPETVQAGYLAEVIDSGDFPHTVTTIFTPQTLHRSEKELANARQSHSNRSRVFRAVGKEDPAEHEAESKELEARREELGRGFGTTAFSAFVTITAPPGDRRTLRDRASWATQKLPGTVLSTTFGDQWATFVSAALPLGIGTRG